MNVPRVGALVLVLVSPAALAEAGFVGEGWVLLEVTPAGPAGVLVRFDWRGPTTVVIKGFDAAHRSYVPAVGVGAGGDVLSVGALGAEYTAPPGLSGSSAGLGTGLPSSWTSRVVIIAGGGVRGWHYEITGENVMWRELARGNVVHSFEPRDFSPLGVDARTVGADAFVAAGRRSIDVSHELVGVAGFAELYGPNRPLVLAEPPPVYPNELRVYEPNGARDCACEFPDSRMSPRPGGPGTYEFEWIGAGARPLHGQMVVVADVPLYD